MEDMENNRLSNFESITNIARNLAVIVISLALIVVFSSQIFRQLRSGKSLIEEIASPLLKVRLTNELNTPDRTRGSEDTAAPSSVAEVAEIIETRGTSWSYVGAYKEGEWRTRYFDVMKPPQTGDALKTVTDVFRRANKPVYVGDSWRMGEIEGVMKSGSKLRVAEVAIIPGVGGFELYWVRGTLQQ